MCRREWTVVYWMCNDVMDRSFVLVPDDGCGGCGEVTAPSLYPLRRMVLGACPDCVAEELWVTLDDLWMPRELALERGWKPSAAAPSSS
ncbi:hypothetical protein ISF_00452 [Cordyceps fumosorosea ARSEF 2679]|uniref:Uncharacterized protein n=1 Tax=Cordyceps fumosorosea (strain ARSEF 2679) TaxID=1081104 RepID=A0A168E9T3_CORFA|nr:hypothetical protein ISF_00452 [Cordyceps fumosorosea ARSEF 2679]OAA73551.1 hypothetical protein ISF_00452 [Cordyceps fumosorosea ARSEF 2679]